LCHPPNRFIDLFFRYLEPFRVGNLTQQQGSPDFLFGVRSGILAQLVPVYLSLAGVNALGLKLSQHAFESVLDLGLYHYFRHCEFV